METPHQSGQSLIELISNDLPELNKTFRRVGQYLLSAPDGFMHKPVQEIALAAEVSEPSVVRFCRRYGFKGLPDFRIALAMALARGSERSSYLEPRISDKAVVNLAQKKAIARFARSLVGTDRSIIVDSGSTAQLFAESLRDAAGLVIMTTALNIVDALRDASQHTVMLPGGTVRFESRSVSGRLVENTLASMRFDTVYLGADAIDPEFGLSTFNEDEAHQNTAMINVCQRVVVLADSTKFKAPALHRFCELDRIHSIVTDNGLPDEVTEMIEARGVTVHRVDPNDGSTQ
ncbi:transcriptional regulator [Aminobacter sp. BE322]|uniref:transcriptional regulator n=1 Tax=unclassified Aminobacter TaxID=2644704 RepID=UPI003D21F721